MAGERQKAVAEAVLRTHGRTFAEEIGIRLKDTPQPLFQLLCASLLLSARIASGNAVEAARALRQAGLTSPRRMVEASWQDRVDVITWHGYKRYDESTATMLGDTAELLLSRYDGDLRKLRREAGGDIDREKTLLKQFKGIGEVGAGIFLREVQGIWDEAYPYADRKVLESAGKLGLPTDGDQLARLVSKADFPRLASGLVRVGLRRAHDEVRRQAA